MRFRFALVFCLIAVPVWAADSLDSLWLQSFGGKNDDCTAAIRMTSDHGFVIAGTTYASRGQVMRVVRTDSVGHVLWNRDCAGDGSMTAHDVQPIAGGFAVAGVASFPSEGREQACLVRLDENGDTVWTARLGQNDATGASAVLPLADGGFVVVGWAVLPGESGMDACLMRTDGMGHLLWYHTYGGAGDEWATGVCVTEDGFALAGQCAPFEKHDATACLIRTDSMGNARWLRRTAITELDRVFGVAATEDGGFMLTVMQQMSWWDESNPIALCKLDSAGILSWLQRYRVGGQRHNQVMFRPAEQGFMLSSYTFSLGTGTRELSVIKTTDEGDLLAYCNYIGVGFAKWERNAEWYWRWKWGKPLRMGLQDYFLGPNPPIVPHVSIGPDAPKPERSARHHSLDSFSNAYFIRFRLNHRERVSVSVFSREGRLVNKVTDEVYPVGEHNEVLDGWQLPAGIYYLCVEAEDLHEVRKIALVR